MRRNYLIFIVIFLICAGANFNILNEKGSSITLKFELGEYRINNIMVDGKEYSEITFNNGIPMLDEGFPDLPHISKSIIIPDDSKMDLRIIQMETETLIIPSVIPSKGNLKRNVNPDTIPYKFDKIYSKDKFFPDNFFEISKEFILRDFRGITLRIHPFRYNNSKKELLVLKEAIIEIYEEGKGGENVLKRRDYNITREFTEIYENFFLNYSNYRQKFPFLNETPGKMLIITADAYYDNFKDFVEWKMKKGIDVEICSVSTIGNTSANIKAKIQNKYNTEGVTWVLLVGEANLIATTSSTYDETCDPVYGYLAGSDNYPDAFISRFSGSSETNIDKQILRTLSYERNPPMGSSWDWYHKGLLTASNEGSPADSTRANWLKDTLLGYTYTEMTKVYEPWGTDAMITNALNNGRSILNHIGHGSTTGFGTNTAFFFDITDVNNLDNVNMLPFLYLCACLSGDFDAVETCCAESWMWAGTTDSPKGAIGVYAASVNQSWVPPTVSQNYAMGLLKRENAMTIGGLCFNGSMYMFEQTGDLEMLETWHIFGDASIDLRTDVPDTMIVEHEENIVPINTDFTVNVKKKDGITPLSNATVCLYLPKQTPKIHSVGFTDENGNVTFNITPANIGDTLWVTVTKHNYRPYEGHAIIIDMGMATKPVIVKPFNYIKIPDKKPKVSFYSNDPQNEQICYGLYWDTLYDFTTPESSIISSFMSGDTAEFMFPNDLLNNKTYWLKVKAKDAGSNLWTNFSSPIAFTIDTTLKQGTCSWFKWKSSHFSSDFFNRTMLKGDTVILQTSGGTFVDTLLKENFESGSIPQGWVVINGNNDSYQWEVGITSDIGSYPPPDFGNYYSFYSDDDAGSGVINYNEEIRTKSIYTGNVKGRLNIKYAYGFRVYQTGEKLRFKIRKKVGSTWGEWIDKIVYTSSVSGNEFIDLTPDLPADSMMFSWFYSDSSASSHWGYACAIDNIILTDEYQLTNNDGSLITTSIVFEEMNRVYERERWGDIIFRKSSQEDSIGIQIEYKNNSNWEVIPDLLIPNNSSGIFFKQTECVVSLDNINDFSTYNELRLKFLFYRKEGKSGNEPKLISVEVGNLNNYVGINEKNDKFEFLISSNIGINEFVFKINMPDFKKDFSLVIYDITGRIIKSFKKSDLKDGKILWKGEDKKGHVLPKGLYFVRFDTGDFKKIEKIIILR